MHIFDYSAFLLKKRSLLFTTIAVFALQSAAKIVSPSDALNIARHYVQVSAQSRQHIKALSAAEKRKTHQVAPSPYYLFNDAQGKGFVLVAGDNEMGEILAYSPENDLDTTHVHPGLRYMLESYRESFLALQQASSQLHRVRVAETDKRTLKKVEPLLKTLWNQTYPYNAMLGKSGSIRYPYTGCVATAVAQIMAFHQWPAQGVGQHQYTVPYYQDRISVDFSQSRYDWANMLNDYSNGSTETQRNAVALLMRDVGVAMNMGYTPWYSGAWGWQAKDALAKHFGYDVALISKSSEGTAAFLRLIQQEISSGYPVYLEGFPTSGDNGHAWVADGVDEKGFVHMNFGWGGQANGYFSLESLSLSQAGAEFGGRPLSFSKKMSAFLAHPHKDGKNTLPAGYQNVDVQLAGRKETMLRLPEGAAKTQDINFPLSIVFQGIINRGKAFEGSVGLAIYNIQQQMVGTPQWADQVISFQQADQINDTPFQFTFNTSSLPKGAYFVAPVCQATKEKGTDSYYPIRNVPQLEFEIVGAQLHVKNEFFQGAGYVWNGNPWSEKPIRAGNVQTLFCPIRTLQGHYRSGTLLFSLINAEGQEVVHQELHDAVTQDDFSTKNIPVTLHFPASLQAGLYRIKAQVRLLDGTLFDVATPLEDVLPQIEVKGAVPASSVARVGRAEVLSQGVVVPWGQKISLREGIQLRLSLNAEAKNAFKGKLKCYFEEKSSGLRVPLLREKFLDNVIIEAGIQSEYTSTRIKSDKLQVVSDKTYRLVVVNELDNGTQIELPFEANVKRTFRFTNALATSPISSVYIPQNRDFFTLHLPTKSAYVVAAYLGDTDKCALATATPQTDGAAKSNPQAIFYREGDYLVSYYSGQVLKWDSEEFDWDKVLSLTPSSTNGSSLQWVQQDGLLRPRGQGSKDIALSTPLMAERVDVLPIQLASHGFASFFAPVQGTVTDAVVYRATINKDNALELHEMQGDIPANTAFLVEGMKSGQAKFHISLAKTLVAPLAAQDNVLFGWAMASSLTPAPHTFALSGEEAAYYRLATWPRPFRAFLMFTKAPTSSADSSWLKWSIVPTGISSISGNSSSNLPLLFDLSGRRTTMPQRGQLIISQDGRKMMR